VEGGKLERALLLPDRNGSSGRILNSKMGWLALSMSESLLAASPRPSLTFL
jgi:hypothetical protein